MNAIKNAAHYLILAVWGVVGVLFTLKTLFVPALLPALLFWAWFAGYAAFTSVVMRPLKSAWAAVAVHAVTLVVLHLVPMVKPFVALRLGLDLLA